MGVTKRIAFLVADRLEELVDPDGGIDRETFAIKCGKGSRTRARLEDRPKTVDTHFEVLGGCSRVEMEDAIR